MHRECNAGNWITVGMTIDSEIALANQERGKDWEYHLISVNTAGQGEPSATVAIML